MVNCEDPAEPPWTKENVKALVCVDKWASWGALTTRATLTIWMEGFPSGTVIVIIAL
jgi:hypothetical protein